jgi:hypothetical protein
VLFRSNYRMLVTANRYDLKFLQQYLRDIANYGNLSGSLDADINTKGNFTDLENSNSSGMIALSDFHLGKAEGDDYASWSKLVLSIKKLYPKGYEYSYDSVILSNPYLKYERYDYLDNIQRMFGKGGANLKAVSAERSTKFNLIVELARYLKVIARNFFKSNYKVGRFAIYNGDLQFNDYSLNEKFSAAATSFNFRADSISKTKKRVEMFLKAGIRPYGNLSVDLSINPNDTGEFNLYYHFNKLSLAMFNPYVITYTSFPIDQGTLEFNGKWDVRNGNVQSVNHLVIINPHLAVRLKRKDAQRLPLPLILSFITERNNLIDYEIPINGELRNPKFKHFNIVSDVLRNIFIKPPSIPFIKNVNSAEDEEEKFLAVKWMTRQVTISKIQKEFLEEMRDFLKKYPDASITITPVLYEEKEKEYILFFQAKKKYYLTSHKMDLHIFNKTDSLIVDKMNVKDSLFVQYLNRQIGNPMIFTLQEKCNIFLGKTTSPEGGSYSAEGKKIVDTRFHLLNKDREILFRSFFKENGLENRIKFQKEEYSIPFNGFSFYRIDYKGEIPKNLKKAYRQMNELNE